MLLYSVLIGYFMFHSFGGHSVICLNLAKTRDKVLLKEQCHEGFGQYNEFYQRGLTIINFLRSFGTRSIKIRKNWLIF